MHEEARTANLLGATSLAVSDRLVTGARAASRVSASGAAALVVLSTSSGLSVTELGRRVGLSQPAAARMVDALQAEKLVERRPGLGRSVTVRLTTTGRRAARHVLAGRAEQLSDVVGALDESEQQQLAALLGKLLTQLYDDVGNAELLCRLCDRAACTKDAACPVGAAERQHRA